MEQANDLFARQHGLAGDRQIRATGLSLDRQRTLIRTQAWTRYARGIVAAGGSPATWSQRAMAATLSAPGALLCGRSAARLHSLDGFARHDGIEVMVHQRAHVLPIKGVTYRYSRHISSADRHIIDSIAVTILPLTIVHLEMNGWKSQKALDSALRDGFSAIWLHEQFQRWQKFRPEPASRVLQALSDRVDTTLPLSWFQRIAKMVLDVDGIALIDELLVFDADRTTLAVLDLADPELMVAVECQSWKWHGSPSAQQRDLRRKRRLREMGWDIVDVWWSDLERIDEVLVDLRIAVERARERITYRKTVSTNGGV